MKTILLITFLLTTAFTWHDYDQQYMFCATYYKLLAIQTKQLIDEGTDNDTEMLWDMYWEYDERAKECQKEVILTHPMPE